MNETERLIHMVGDYVASGEVGLEAGIAILQQIGKVLVSDYQEASARHDDELIRLPSQN